MNGAEFNDRHVIVEVTAGQKKGKFQGKRNKWSGNKRRPHAEFAFEKKGKKSKKNKRTKNKRN
jgi:hypothetical protein